MKWERIITHNWKLAARHSSYANRLQNKTKNQNSSLGEAANTDKAVSARHFGTGTKLSRPPAYIFCYNRPYAEERFNITCYYY